MYAGLIAGFFYSFATMHSLMFSIVFTLGALSVAIAGVRFGERLHCYWLCVIQYDNNNYLRTRSY